ncbi:DUF4230 domain-containing protein [Clostridium carnis]
MFKLFKRKSEKRGVPIKVTFLLLILFVLIGLFLGYKIFVSPKNSPKQWKLTDNTNKGIKFFSEESLVNEIRSVNKIIPLETELTDSVVIDKSFGNLDILKKFKRIKFFANCSYAVDLSQLTENDTKINKLKNEIELSLPKPEVFSVNINQNKTIYEETSTGLLRFGDVELTTEEYGVIQREVCNNFEIKMKDPEIYEKAISNTIISLEKLLKQITTTEMNVKIKFKE